MLTLHSYSTIVLSLCVSVRIEFFFFILEIQNIPYYLCINLTGEFMQIFE